MQKRLNDTFFSKDLLAYLKQGIAAGRTGSFIDVISWNIAYYTDIKDNLLELCKMFQNLFPFSVVELGGCVDSSETIMINVYGLNDWKQGGICDKAYSLADTLSGFGEEPDKAPYKDYLFLFGPRTDTATQQHYPEIWAEVLQKRKEISF